MLPEFSGDFIQWLRGFYYTATCGSMTAAMKKMNRNQSALTYQIRSLEQEFGVKLFSGSKTNRVLTEEGKFLLSKSAMLFSQIDALRDQLAHLPATVKGPLSISCMSSFYNHILPDLVHTFSQQYPDVKFRLIPEMLESKLFEDISTNKVDVGILASEMIPDEFLAIPLFRTDITLFASPQVKLPPENMLDLTDLAQMTIVAPSIHSSLWQNIVRQAQRYGVKLNPQHIILQQDCLIRCVSQGLGVSMLDRFVLEEALFAQKIQAVSLSRFFRPRQYYMVLSQAGKYQYPQVKAFLNFMKVQFEISSETLHDDADDADIARH